MDYDERKRRRKEKKRRKEKLKSIQKFCSKVFKKFSKKELEPSGNNGSRRQTVYEILQRRIDILSTESSPTNAEKTTMPVPRRTQSNITPDTEHRKTKSNADAAASIVIVSDSSDSSKQESTHRTTENHGASTSGMDKHNGKFVRKRSSNSLEPSSANGHRKKARKPSNIPRRSEVNGYTTMPFTNNGHLPNENKVRKAKKLQPTERTRSSKNDKKYLIGKSKNKKKVERLEKQRKRKKEEERLIQERIQRRLRAIHFFKTDIKHDFTSSENENENVCEISPEKITSPITTEATNSGQSRLTDLAESTKDFSQLSTLTRNLATINNQTAVSGEVNACVSTEHNRPSLNHHVPLSVADDIRTQIDEAHVSGKPNSNECEGYDSPDANDEINKIPNHQNEENVNEQEENLRVLNVNGYQEEENGDEKHGDDEELGDEEHDFEDISDEERDYEENFGGDRERRDNEEHGYKEHGYEERGYEERGYEERGYEERGYEERGYEERGYEERGYEERGYEEYDYEEYDYEEYDYEDMRYQEKKYSERTERLLSEDDNNCFIIDEHTVPMPPKKHPLPVNEYNDETVPYMLRTIADDCSSQSSASDSRGQYENGERSCSVSPTEGESYEMSYSAAESFNKSIQFFKSSMSNKVLLLLKTKLYFHGALNIRLLNGSARIFGYKLQRCEKVTAHSLTGHGFLHISPGSHLQHVENNQNGNDHSEELTEYFSPSNRQNILSNFSDTTDAIVELENDSGNNTLTMIEKYMEKSILPNINRTDEYSQFQHAESVLRCKFSQNREMSLNVSQDWQKIVMSLTSRQIIIGKKGVGKSTLVRYLINKNLAEFPKILLIDLDVSQPEIFLPQTISATIITKPLLGPGFFKNLSPSIAYYFCGVHVFSSLMEYFNCVLKLFKYCRCNKEFKAMPWIVNTQGIDTHQEITAGIIRALNPTDVIQIQGHDNNEVILNHDKINNYRFNFLVDEMKDIQQKCSYALHNINTVTQAEQIKLWGTAITKTRLATIIARLSHKMPQNGHFLSVKPPVRASLDELRISMYNDIGKAKAYSNIINGNLCFLCQCMDDGFLTCYGIALVRGIDTNLNQVYIWPSVNSSQLENVNTFGICVVPVPMSMLVDHCSRSISRIPYVYREEDT